MEKDIVVVVRELLEALRWVHANTIIHRDIKCGNILLSESGGVQLCDFGVSAPPEVSVASVDKRSSVMGTMHHMAPEILRGMFSDDKIEYGRNVDIWSLGTTTIEMATGLPPNAKIGNPKELFRLMSGGTVPKLEGDQFSDELKDFVAQCCSVDLKTRPSAVTLQQHPLVRHTQRRLPTSGLRQLIRDYVKWETAGGKRHTLFSAHGAQPVIRESMALKPGDLPPAFWDFGEDDGLVRKEEEPFRARLAPGDKEKTILKRGTIIGVPEGMSWIADQGEAVEEDLTSPRSMQSNSRDEDYQPDHELGLMFVDPERGEDHYRRERDRLRAARERPVFTHPSRERNLSTFNMDEMFATEQVDDEEKRRAIAELFEGFPGDDEPAADLGEREAKQEGGLAESAADSSDQQAPDLREWRYPREDPPVTARSLRRMPDLSVAIPPNPANQAYRAVHGDETPASSVYDRFSGLPSAPPLSAPLSAPSSPPSAPVLASPRRTSSSRSEQRTSSLPTSPLRAAGLADDSAAAPLSHRQSSSMPEYKRRRLNRASVSTSGPSSPSLPAAAEVSGWDFGEPGDDDGIVIESFVSSASASAAAPVRASHRQQQQRREQPSLVSSGLTTPWLSASGRTSVEPTSEDDYSVPFPAFGSSSNSSSFGSSRRLPHHLGHASGLSSEAGSGRAGRLVQFPAMPRPRALGWDAPQEMVAADLRESMLGIVDALEAIEGECAAFLADMEDGSDEDEEME